MGRHNFVCFFMPFAKDSQNTSRRYCGMAHSWLHLSFYWRRSVLVYGSFAAEDLRSHVPLDPPLAYQPSRARSNVSTSVGILVCVCGGGWSINVLKVSIILAGISVGTSSMYVLLCTVWALRRGKAAKFFFTEEGQQNIHLLITRPCLIH